MGRLYGAFCIPCNECDVSRRMCGRGLHQMYTLVVGRATVLSVFCCYDVKAVQGCGDKSGDKR